MRSQLNICNIPLPNIELSVTLVRVDLAANLCKFSSFSKLFTILYHTCSCSCMFMMCFVYREYEEICDIENIGDTHRIYILQHMYVK